MTGNKVIFAMFVAVVVIIGGCIKHAEEKPSSAPDFEQINLYEGGKMESLNETEELADVLFSVLHKLNIQAKCVFTEERIREIKRNDKVVEAVFVTPEDIVISQRVEPEDRDHIKAENGYRVLKNVKKALFILEDNQGRGLEGHVLVGHEAGGRVSYSCWAIQEEGGDEIDKGWVDRVSGVAGGAS